MSTTDQITIWAEQILKDSYEKWKSLKDEYDFGNYGFSVFYSPIVENPDLMILGFNPGGDDSSFDEGKALQIPVSHDYFVSSYHLANRMKHLFEKTSLTAQLEKSVKLNIIFFRSKNVAQLNSIKSDILEDIYKFCFGKVQEIIGRLRPKVIITEGILTYDKLLWLLQQQPLNITWTDQACKTGRNERRIYSTANSNLVKLIGLIHLSGARPRPNEQEFHVIAESLRTDMAAL